MGQIPGQPTNTNPLQTTGFRFVIQRLPTGTFFGQGANIPGITFGIAEQTTALSIKIPIPGDTIEFEPLSLKFMVDENLTDWLEVYNWILALSRIKELSLGDVGGQPATVSDATLYILTSSRNVNVRVFFRDLFPTNITGIEFDATVTDLDPIVGEATFKFCYYDIEVIGQDQLDLELSEFCSTNLTLEITDASNYVAGEDFIVGETVEGVSSMNTATVISWTPAAVGSPGSVLVVAEATVFSTGEIITGGTSGFSITEGGQVTVTP